MAYTADQAARIEAANKKIADAQKAYDDSVAQKNSHYATLQSIFNRSELGGSCYDGRPSLDDQLNWGKMSQGSCKKTVTFSGITTKCPKCLTSTTDFNNEKNIYDSAVSNVTAKLQALNGAKDELKNLLDSIGEEVANDPAVIIEKDKIEAEANVQKFKWIFFGIYVLMIVAGGLVIGYRTEIKKGYIALGGLGLIVAGYLVFFGFKKK